MLDIFSLQFYCTSIQRFPDIRLSGIRQSDFCPSTYAYHTFAYQDLCLSETEFEIRTIAHQGGTFAFQKLMSVNIFVYVYIVCPSQNLNGETKKRKLFEEFCKILLCIQAFFGHKSGGGNGQNLWAIVLSEMRVWDDLCSLWNRVTGSCEKVGNI